MDAKFKTNSLKTIIMLIIIGLVLSCNNDEDEKDENKDSSITGSYPGSVTLTHSGISREYYVYVPTDYNEAISVPIMFNFHGGSGSIAAAIEYSDMRSLADTNDFILVYPQGIGDPTDSSKPSVVWTYKTAAATTAVDNLGFVEAMIDTLVTQYNIDEDRIYACGFSNGGEFSHELAVRLNNRIASIASVASSMQLVTYNQRQQLPSHPTAVLTIHGTADSFYQYNGTPSYFRNLGICFTI